MLTLHKATEETKLALKFGVFGILGIMCLILLIRLGAAVKELLFPTPPPPPTVLFGKIPKVIFPKDATDRNLSYTINTISGILPTFPDRIPVYKLENPVPDLLSLSRVENLAAQVGFTLPPTTLSPTLYRFDANDSLERSLTFDILSLNFSLASQFASASSVLQGSFLPNQQDAIKKATDFLSTLQSFPQDIDDQATTTELFSLSNGTIFPATSLSTAQLVRVDFFQKEINNYPIYYPFPPYSPVNVTVAGGFYGGQIVSANYLHHAISRTFATYPIKQASEAFSALQKHNAYIASYLGTDTSIQITDESLGYYIGGEDQKYLYPIVVFQGTNNFIAYVPAIKEVWLNQ